MEKTKGGKRKRGTGRMEDGLQLYACSIEYKHGKVAYVINAIRLSDLLSNESNDVDTSGLRRVTYWVDKNLPLYPNCGVLDTKILFAGGQVRGSVRGEEAASREIYVFETSDDQADPKIQGEIFDKFLGGKVSPFLEVVCGKLYALDGTAGGHDPMFEVFDPALGKWSSLPSPPYRFEFEYYYAFTQSFSVSVLNNNIICFSSRCPQVFSFDCSNPQSKWEITESFKGLPDPPFKGHTLNVVDDDDCLLFTYQVSGRSKPIEVYQLIDDIMHTIKALDLPKYDLPHDLHRPYHHSFVNLGDRKVCLVMASYMNPDFCDWMSETQKAETTGFMRFFVVTLEFSKRRDWDINCDLKSKWDVIILNTRIYDSKPLPEDTEDASMGAMLLGCFLPQPASMDKDADPSSDNMDDDGMTIIRPRTD